MEILKFKRPFHNSSFFNTEEDISLCCDGVRTALSAPVDQAHSFNLKVSTEPVDGFKEVSLRFHRGIALIAGFSLGSLTSETIEAKYKTDCRLWVKICDIN